MEIEAHGGGCCGITHLSGFEQPKMRGSSYGWGRTGNLEGFKHFVENFVSCQYDEGEIVIDGFEVKVYIGEGWDEEPIPSDKKFSCILEATLTDHQMTSWAPHLKEAGFKIVNRFLNSNSGNVVNVLHYNPAGRRKLPEAPYKW